MIYSHHGLLCVPNRLVDPDSLRPHGLRPPRRLCLQNSPGENIGMGSHFLLQANLLDPQMEPRSPAWQVDSLLSEPPGKLERMLASREKQ